MTRRRIISAIAASVTALGLKEQDLPPGWTIGNATSGAVRFNDPKPVLLFEHPIDDRVLIDGDTRSVVFGHLQSEGVIAARLYLHDDQKWHTKPQNGQCPACGVMAPEWKRPTRTVQDRVEPVEGSPYAVRAITHQEPYGPTEHLERCSNCSAAFWQDAMEGGKP